MNILFTVCGRAGSKGVRNKNVRDFLGHPCVYYTLAVIELYRKYFPEDHCDVVLNTDSAELWKITENNRLLPITLIERKEELSGDFIPKIAVIADSLTMIENKSNVKYDTVIDLDITSPLRTIQDLCQLVKAFQTDNYDVVFSVTESRRTPYFNMVKEENGFYKRVIDTEFTARQQAPVTYDMNASMYAYKSDFLKKNKNIFDGHCGIVTMLDTAVLDIDTENDFELMQVIGKYLFETNQQFQEVKQMTEKL